MGAGLVHRLAIRNLRHAHIPVGISGNPAIGIRNDGQDGCAFGCLGPFQRGFQITAIHPDAVTESRKIKPEIPLIGLEGIPLRDEIELSMEL